MICDSAFSSSGLNEVELSNGITEIGEGAFYILSIERSCRTWDGETNREIGV